MIILATTNKNNIETIKSLKGKNNEK